jgi:hypothetical protein
MKDRDRGTGISEQGSANREMEHLLRSALTPVGDRPEPDRDLWPAMLRRLDPESVSRVSRVPWFDWALAGGLVAFAAIAPRTIPVILYYL